jgi:hypothetical protein
MPKPGFTAVTITQQAHDKARQRYNQKVKLEKLSKSFSKYVNDIIIEKVEADQVLALAAPHIEKSALVGSSILLKDNKLGRMVEVQVRGKERDLFCMLDKRNDCVHVGFSYAIPQVYLIMKKIRHTR